MKLEATLNDLSGVPEELQENYVEIDGEDGKSYRLAQLDGYESPEGIAGLKSALQKERTYRKNAERDLRTLQEKLEDANGVDELRDRLTAQEQRLADAAKKSAVLEAVQGAGGDAALLLPLVSQRVKATKGDDDTYTVQVVSESGAPLLNEDGEPLGLQAYVESLKPKHPNAFKGSGNAGGGGPSDEGGSHSGNGRYSLTGKRRSQMTIPEKCAYINEHGEKAFLDLPY